MDRRGWEWPAFTLACLVVAGAAATGNLSAIPVAVKLVLLILLLVAIGYGLLSRRWIRVLVAAAALLVALVIGTGAVFSGPATSVAPKAAWTGVTLMLAFHLALAIRMRRGVHPSVVVPDDAIPLVRARLDALTARVDAIEEAVRS
ncbi:hypothetical protein [Actinoplanes sp. NPDC051494]|uniref:hypothetical protein n=1 Tax=Actinoplanes sp. NPDC051494 TaxID=3363907 RepID=UPI0037B9A11C